MLPDATNRRKEELAQVLYALRRGVDSLDMYVFQPGTLSSCGFIPLSSRSSPPQNQLRPSTPRVYRDCLSTVGQVPLGSLSDFETSPFSDRLIFSASLMRPNVAPERVFVKLVTRPYGEKVHDYLASHGCAPKLYGCKALEGAPMAYVMEHLDTDWISLFDLAVGQNRAVAQAPDVLMAIRNAVERVLSILETATLVHGDFRSNNIMVRLDHGGRPMLSDSGSVQLKVVDFDWSGEAGAVRYPATRNTDIAWPGRSGEAIEAGDDRRLFDWWWPRFSPPL
ncbi:hypothetical protein OE88DRAFT_387055 [Heliocybe sulcata]|uniref:Non-specific serine/threonine protein kinase n=1 Tax=Heliocybe sulcata TaxID=5364 RepID=A0A5C3MY09_9AGAM|nr:hypothetical protein OE88DRAFT_387055 [Heliocybe sulcata]